MLIKGVTLRGLEVFEALASSGSVAKVAVLTGLSQPAVSQQLRNLETALGVDLVDHARRPMRLTPAGTLFLTRAEVALSELRTAQSELTVMDLAHIRAFNIGIIDDFDDKITPHLATILADSLSGCSLKMITASSYELAQALLDKHLHIAVSASAGNVIPGVLEYPIARDPFIVVAPRAAEFDPSDILAVPSLPFLRYDKKQLISAQIEGALSMQQIRYPDRFEIGSHLALMAMVARGIGWAITTPLGYMRAQRFHGDMRAFAWPLEPFARQISVFASADWSDDVPKNVAQTMRHLIQSHMIEPALSDLPFLAGALCVLDSAEMSDA